MTPITTAEMAAKQVRANSRDYVVAQEVNDGDRCAAGEHEEVARENKIPLSQDPSLYKSSVKSDGTNATFSKPSGTAFVPDE